MVECGGRLRRVDEEGRRQIVRGDRELAMEGASGQAKNGRKSTCRGCRRT